MFPIRTHSYGAVLDTSKLDVLGVLLVLNPDKCIDKKMICVAERGEETDIDKGSKRGKRLK